MKMVKDLLSWKNPGTTGAVFGILNLAFFVQVYLGYPFLTMILYLLFGVSAVGAFLSYIGRHAIVDDSDFEFVPRERFEQIFASVEASVSGCFPVQLDDKTCIEMFIAFALIFYIGKLFSLGAILWIVTLSAFSIPALYDQNTKHFHNFINLGQHYFTFAREQASIHIPRAKSAIKYD
jgi:hypothetical protein